MIDKIYLKIILNLIDLWNIRSVQYVSCQEDYFSNCEYILDKGLYCQSGNYLPNDFILKQLTIIVDNLPCIVALPKPLRTPTHVLFLNESMHMKVWFEHPLDSNIFTISSYNTVFDVFSVQNKEVQLVKFGNWDSLTGQLKVTKAHKWHRRRYLPNMTLRTGFINWGSVCHSSFDNNNIFSSKGYFIDIFFW